MSLYLFYLIFLYHTAIRNSGSKTPLDGEIGLQHISLSKIKFFYKGNYWTLINFFRPKYDFAFQVPVNPTCLLSQLEDLLKHISIGIMNWFRSHTVALTLNTFLGSVLQWSNVWSLVNFVIVITAACWWWGNSPKLMS